MAEWITSSPPNRSLAGHPASLSADHWAPFNSGGKIVRETIHDAKDPSTGVGSGFWCGRRREQKVLVRTGVNADVPPCKRSVVGCECDPWHHA